LPCTTDSKSGSQILAQLAKSFLRESPGKSRFDPDNPRIDLKTRGFDLKFTQKCIILSKSSIFKRREKYDQSEKD
jgi:hypothetical protein